MRRPALLILAAWCACTTPAASSERTALPPRPYDIVPVMPQPALNDAKFEAFRKDLAAVAKSRIYADLARLMTLQGFFWDRDFARAYNHRRPPVDNLAAAIRLEHRGGEGWERLARFAAEAAVERQDARPGTVCAPARPRYDVVAYAQLLDRTFTAANDWAYPRAAKLEVRSAPQADAAVIAELGPHFVRLLDAKDGGERTFHEWIKIVTPDGRTGYAEPKSLGALTAPQLCFGKDALGRWHIVGFVAGG
jgi:hypothetical protein